jgi:hypothetical protein
MSTRDKLLILFSGADERQVDWLKLTKLKLVMFKTPYLDALIFDLLPNLQELTLKLNDITQFDKSLFKRTNNLRQLSVRGNIMSRIDNRLLLANECFQGLINLRVLHLEYILIDSYNVFNCLHSLDELKVVDTNSTKIENCHFENPRLKKLTLELTEVKYISPHVFDQLTSLDYLDITCEGVKERFETSLTPRVIKVWGPKLLKLNSVDLSNIEEIGFTEQIECGDGSVTLNKLKRITLSEYDQPLSVNNNSFQQFSNLEDLKLTIYSLSSLPSGQLNSLTELKDIEIIYRYSRMIF